MIYYAVQGKRAVGPLNNAKFFSIYLLLESATTFLLLITVLKARRETLAGLGLRRDGWKSQKLLGFALVPFLFLINAAVTNAFRIYLPQYYVEKNPLMELMHTPQQLLLIVFSALIAGGIKEELQRVNERLTGNRFQRGLVIHGGVHHDLTTEQAASVIASALSVTGGGAPTGTPVSAKHGSKTLPLKDQNSAAGCTLSKSQGSRMEILARMPDSAVAPRGVRPPIEVEHDDPPTISLRRCRFALLGDSVVRRSTHGR